MSNIISLKPERPCENVVGTLRRIADDLENGSLDWPVTTAVLVCGHTDAERSLGNGDLSEQVFWTTYAMGPRTDTFTVRGLVSSAMRRWNHGDEK